MKVVLMHGKNTDPSGKWYPWFAQEMDQLGIECIIPALPKADNPYIEEWIAELEKNHPDENTVLIGHSRGGVAVMRWLEQAPESTRVKKVILLATNSGFLHKMAIPSESNHGFYTEAGYNFDKIRTHCTDFVVMHSKDDKWVPYEAGQENARALDARFISYDDKGHFGTGVDTMPDLVRETTSLQ